jgi:hypothetical protein
MKKLIIGKDRLDRPLRVIDETGNRYGRLLVESFIGVKGHGRPRIAWWLCLCDCGNKLKTRGTSLRFGRTKSCGCYHDELVKNGTHRLPKNEAAFNSVYRRIRGGATKRNLIWELTKEEVKNLVRLNCFYCGAVAQRIKNEVNGSVLWNGIDQKLPCAGYTLQNCVTCCYECNRMKLNIPFGKFLDKCEQITKLNKNR